MLKVIDLRQLLDFPFPVSSACRCASHNNNVSHTGFDGPHVPLADGCHAIDILVFGARAFRLLEYAFKGGRFTGIGISQKGDRDKRFIHLDDLTTGRPWAWTY